MKPANSSSLLKTYILTIISIILWGFSFVWTNDILQKNVPPFTFLFIRLSIAGILLFLYSKITGELQKVSFKDFKYMFLMAFFEPFIYFIGETYGMVATGSGVIASVIIATIPVFCMFSEKLLYKVPFTVYKIFGTAITIPGIIMVIMKDGESASIEHLYGIGLLFMAVAGATGYASVVKKLSGTYNSLTIATYQFAIGAVLFLPLFLKFGVEGLNESFFTKDIIVPVISLAVLCSCIAFVFWITSIKNLGMTKANIFSALIPAVSAIGAAMLGQEKITIIATAGICVVISGVIIAQKD